MCGSVQTTVWTKTCIILAWETHVRIGWKYSKTCDEETPLYPGQSVPTWQVPSSQVCPNNMKTPYFKMIIPYFIHFSFNSYHAYTYTHPTSYRFMQFDNNVWELNRHKIAFEIKEITYIIHHIIVLVGRSHFLACCRLLFELSLLQNVPHFAGWL